LELQITDIVDEYKNKTNKKKLKMRRIKRHVIEKEVCFQLVFGAILMLVVIVIDDRFVSCFEVVGL
jgi:hypothetical protein